MSKCKTGRGPPVAEILQYLQGVVAKRPSLPAWTGVHPLDKQVSRLPNLVGLVCLPKPSIITTLRNNI